jgi:L-alanine-DL-glutamate epimerase-like enolase superfamily enzyme
LPAIQNLSAEIVEIPLQHRFVTAQDKLARQVSRPVVITVTLEEGRAAVGEAVPVAYVTGETPESVLAAVSHAAPSLIGGDALRLRPLLRRLAGALPHAPTARAGIETALHAAFAEVTGVSLWRLFGGAAESVETDITLSIVPDAVDRAREAAARGFRRFKMKVGSPDRKADFTRMVAVHEAVPGAFLRLDANQGFTPDEALDFIRRALKAGIRLELVEQPVPKEDLAALDYVAAASSVPIFADEAVKSPADALGLVQKTRVQGINVKLMKAGISGALDIIAIAQAAGRRLMLGCMLETRRGISFSLALACGTGAFEFLDLDSHMLLREEGENPYFTQQGPVLNVASKDQ